MRADVILLLVLILGFAGALVMWALQTRSLRGRHRRAAR